MPMTGDLAQAARIGPFFGLITGDRGPDGWKDPARAGYRPLAGWYAAEPSLERSAAVAARLGIRETRVGASLSFQGLAARLWSVALGTASLTGRVPDLSAERLWWDPERSAPHDLWLPDARDLRHAPGSGGAGPVADDHDSAPSGAAAQHDRALAVQLRAAVLTGHLEPLADATRAGCPLAPGLLWGNAGSALAGSLGVLRDWCRTHHRPEAAARALAVTRLLFRTPPLRDTGHFHPGTPFFVRRSCCLYYRVPGGGYCGDCALGRS